MIDRKAEISRQSAVGSPQKNKVILILLAIFLTISLPLQVFAEKKDQKKVEWIHAQKSIMDDIQEYKNSKEPEVKTKSKGKK